MTSTTFFIIFIPILSILLLAINLILAPHNPYQEKDSVFECGFHSFLGQNRTQFSVSFFIFALLFLLFDLEILLVYPYSVSSYTNDIYGLIIMLVFFVLLTLGFIFELGKNALSIESKQTSISNNDEIPKPHAFITISLQSTVVPSKRDYEAFKSYYPAEYRKSKKVIPQDYLPAKSPDNTFSSYEEWEKYKDANLSKLFKIQERMSKGKASEKEIIWESKNYNKIMNPPFEKVWYTTDEEEVDNLHEEFSRNNNISSRSHSPQPEQTTNRTSLLPIISTNIFRFIPVLSVFSFIFSLLVFFTINFNIDFLSVYFNFILPYINISFLDLLSILLLLQFISLLKKISKTTKLIKNLIAKGNHVEIVFITYITIIFIIILILIF